METLNFDWETRSIVAVDYNDAESLLEQLEILFENDIACIIHATVFVDVSNQKGYDFIEKLKGFLSWKLLKLTSIK